MCALPSPQVSLPMSASVRQMRHAIAAALVLGATGYGGYAAWARLGPPRTMLGEQPPGCDLQRTPCRARFADGSELLVDLRPRPVGLVTPFTVDVEVRAMSAAHVDIALNSPGSLAFSRRTLPARARRRFSGETTLAVCSSAPMRWRLQVVARGGRTAREAMFEFETAPHTFPTPQ